MKEKQFPINRHTWNRFILNVKQFATSEYAGRKATWLFAVLIFFMFGINALNVLNSYVGRDFMTAIEDRNRAEFIRLALVFIGVFAASTIVAVIFRYTEECLGLLWREWLTRRGIISYGNHRFYYRLKMKGEVGNPDQRIADDIRTYTATTLSFLLMLLNASFTVIAFSGVLWSISPLLFVVAVVYAAAGTLLTFIFGRPLIRLNYDQLDKEANFRASLIYLRANAESVALSRREGHLIELSMRNLGDLVANFRRIIAINRNVNFFTTGYNWLIQLIPALIVAPLFIDRKVEFGVITQAAFAFTQLLGAFSLIVTQFQSISSYTAVVARLISLVDASEQEKDAGISAIAFSKDEGQVAYTGLTLRSPRSGRVLIKDLTLAIPCGRHVQVWGPDGTARSALFHVTAGLWDAGEGHIARPNLEQIMLLTELPYLPPGTLRELFMLPWPEEERPNKRTLAECQVPEERILETLRTLKIESLIKGFGLDNRHHWENTLPLVEQQLLVVARLLLANPRFAFLERPSTTLSPEQFDWILGMLRERSITYVTFEDEKNGLNLEHFDALLELEKGGAWTCKPIKGGQIVEESPGASG
ncbi:MAG: ABC transporter transmembrane domain-containing protein [Proteobacteria bacterium]|nr:ABC transporter transmembrane domain-containing protein [Pseudomonadota bacterium]